LRTVKLSTTERGGIFGVQEGCRLDLKTAPDEGGYVNGS
jgi:hypothetical protein